MLYKKSDYIPMVNSTMDTNTDPEKHLGVDASMLVGGTGATMLGAKKYIKTRNNTKNYSNKEKQYKKLLKDIVNYKETNKMSDALKTLSKKHNAKNESAMKAALKDEYRPIIKARRYKALGILGLATGLYGAKNTLDDINPHPVLNDV